MTGTPKKTKQPAKVKSSPVEEGLRRYEGIRLKHLKIENFKGIDSFEIDFPVPLMKDDPDIFVIGSKNGVGKTTLLEAISLLIIIASFEKHHDFIPALFSHITHNDLADLLIRAGKQEIVISAKFTINNFRDADLKLIVSRAPLTAQYQFDGDAELLNLLATRTQQSPSEALSMFAMNLTGLTQEITTLLPHLLYLNSYRRVREGSLKVATSEKENQKEFHNTFKSVAINAHIGSASVFENLKAPESQKTLEILQMLVSRYADCDDITIRLKPDNTYDLRVKKRHLPESYSFDGLSSGQKEMISTLFLIWHYTRDASAIVLIDEPELHMNAEWQQRFIRVLKELAPNNQYILATHSEFVFSSVLDESRRILIHAD